MLYLWMVVIIQGLRRKATKVLKLCISLVCSSFVHFQRFPLFIILYFNFLILTVVYRSCCASSVYFVLSPLLALQTIAWCTMQSSYLRCLITFSAQKSEFNKMARTHVFLQQFSHFGSLSGFFSIVVSIY